MLEVLPNLRGGLLGLGLVLGCLSLALVLFTSYNRAVQNGTYYFGQGQWLGMVGTFVFALLAAFGYSLPAPPAAPEQPSGSAEAQLRLKAFNKSYDRCLWRIGATPAAVQAACAVAARRVADNALGVVPPPARVVYQQRDRWRQVDHRVGQRERASRYDTFYDSCVQSESQGGLKPNVEQLSACADFAQRATNQSYGPPYQVRVRTN